MYEIPLFRHSVVAAADLSATTYRAVVIGASGAGLAGAGVVPDGICQNQPAAGEPATIESKGVSFAEAGAAISQGDLVATNGTGQVVTAGTSTQTCGRALEAAGASGEIIPVLLGNYGVTSA